MAVANLSKRITNIGKEVPNFIYGTAWKKERTTDLVVQAVLAGFRGIDTACQPRHYREDLVGESLQILFNKHQIRREDLFIQTKFTPVSGQDENSIPYDKTKSLKEQIRESFQKSKENLHVDIIDSYLLHSPLETYEKTMEVWEEMEKFQQTNSVRHIGLSNVYSLKFLQKLYEEAQVKPSFIQNRFYAKSNYDRTIRNFCNENNIIYQSFWTLTANPHIISSHLVTSLSTKYNQSREQIFFRFVLQLGILPLTGTTSVNHMKEDLLSLSDFQLDDEEVRSIYHSLFEIDEED